MKHFSMSSSNATTTNKGDIMSYTIEGGLIVGPESGQCAGYIFNFAGHGAYDPTGKIKVGDLELTEEQVKAHNKILADAELKAIVERGKGTFYFSYDLKVDPPYSPINPRWQGRSTRRYSNYRVSNFDGTFKVSCFANRVFTPGFNCSERWHVHFIGPDGKKWYGIHQGETHQLLRARRLKKQE